MDELLFINCTWGWYQHFAPLYIYSVLSAHPNAFLRIVFLEDVYPSVAETLADLRSEGFTRFEIFRHKPRFKEEPLWLGERWLFDEHYYDGFKYAWIADIDCMHYSQENPDFVESQVKAAAAEGYCYANCVREAPVEDCMAGWHFIIVKPYFDAMRDVLAEYKSKLNFVHQGDNPYMHNERLLYHLVKKGIGLKEADDPTRKNKWTCVDAIHLGNYRIGKNIPDWQVNLIGDQIRSQCSHPVFQRMVDRTNDKNMNQIFTSLKRQFFPKSLKLL